MRPVSGAPRRAAAVQKPLMNAKSKPARSMRRAERPSWQQGPCRRRTGAALLATANRGVAWLANWSSAHRSFSTGRIRRGREPARGTTTQSFSPAEVRALRAAPADWPFYCDPHLRSEGPEPSRAALEGAQSALGPHQDAGQSQRHFDATSTLLPLQSNAKGFDRQPVKVF